jgi:hypothetical protein
MKEFLGGFILAAAIFYAVGYFHGATNPFVKRFDAVATKVEHGVQIVEDFEAHLRKLKDDAISDIKKLIPLRWREENEQFMRERPATQVE